MGKVRADLKEMREWVERLKSMLGFGKLSKSPKEGAC